MTRWLAPPGSPRSTVTRTGPIGDAGPARTAADGIRQIADQIDGSANAMPVRVAPTQMRGPHADVITRYTDAHLTRLRDLASAIRLMADPLEEIATAIESANEAYAVAGPDRWPEDIPIPQSEGEDDEAYPNDRSYYLWAMETSRDAAAIREGAVATLNGDIARIRGQLQQAAVDVAAAADGDTADGPISRLLRGAATSFAERFPMLRGLGLDFLEPDLETGRIDRLEDLVLDELRRPGGDLEDLAARLDMARALGIDPQEYATPLQDYWQRRVAGEAGIDLDTWDPALGSDFNRETIEAVYRFYGELYLENPDLQWAGLANAVGGSFAAGFFDLDATRDILERIDDIRHLPGLEHKIPGHAADWTERDLAFFEETFLSMQQQIFLDMGAQHQAYADGGVEALREMHLAGLITAEVMAGWEGTATGDPDAILDAAETFAYHEQWIIIQDEYDDMRDHSPTGELFTWMITTIGEPSIPGANGYPDVFPLHVEVETPGPHRIPVSPVLPLWWVDNPLQGTVTIETPFPDGNIADADDRWDLFLTDTLPAYQALTDEEKAALASADVGDRIDEYRIEETWDDILRELATDWEIDDFDQ